MNEQIAWVPTGAGERSEVSTARWQERYSGAIADTFGPPQRILVRGEGAYVWDSDDKRYLDLLAGIAVNALGHAHPALTSMITAQMGVLGHVSNFFGTAPQISLAESLLESVRAPEGSRVFFTNSGAEANEAAFKLVRLHGGPQRPRVLALEGAFHGRTMGALALTHKAAYREPFEPLPGGVEFLPFGDFAALEAAFADDGARVAGFFVEPIQGEAGVRPLPPGYLARARELTSRHGALLVVDEVQTGVGRTGTWLAIDHEHLSDGVRPDVVTLAKGLGGGFPIGAMLALGEAGAIFGRGQHGSTFGGNPVAAMAALTTMGVIARDGLLEHVRSLGAQWRAELAACGNPLVAEVRGEGFLIAVRLTRDVAPAVQAAALEAGFIVNAVAPDAIRLAPPLILSAEQAASFTQFLATVAVAE